MVAITWILLIIALIAAALGFLVLAGTMAVIAKIVFFVGIIAFVASLLFGGKKDG